MGADFQVGDLRKWLDAENRMKVIDCSKLETKFDSYSSFKVTGYVPKDTLQDNGEKVTSIMDDSLWPDGVLVRPFYEKKTKTRHESSGH